MKNIKALTAFLTALIMVLSLGAAVAAEDGSGDALMKIALGDSGYSVTVPNGFFETALTEEDRADDMVAAFWNGKELDTENKGYLTIDIYEMDIAEVGALEKYIAEDCAEYSGSELSLDAVCNGIPVCTYRADSELEGTSYYDVTYAFETDGKIVQVDFSWTDESLNEWPAEIMDTLCKEETVQIPLGFSGYGILVPSDTSKVDVAEDEVAKGLYESFYSELTGVAIDVYELANEGGVSIEEAAAAQAAAYSAITDFEVKEINGIPAAEFVCQAVYAGVEYTNLVLVIDNGFGGFTDVVFYLTSYANYLQAKQMITTLADYIEPLDVSLDPVTLRLGTSMFTVELPSGYVMADASAEDMADDMLASYYLPFALFDFDLYEIVKDEQYPSLAVFTEKDAFEYEGTDIDYEADFNGVPMTYYRSYEDLDGSRRICDAYAFESGDKIIQLCFYYSPEDNAADDVAAVMESIAPIGTTRIETGAYTLTVPADYTAEVISFEEEGTSYTYYSSPTSAAIFYIYDFANESHMSLADYVTADCEIYEGMNLQTDKDVNGIPVGVYNIEILGTGANKTYIATIVFANGEDAFTEIDIVLDGNVAAGQAEMILKTLA